MVYESFLQTIKENLAKQLGSEYSLILRQVPKNNGILLDGLCINRLGEKIAPTIYLNEYYQQFQEGTPVQEILHCILTLYHENTALPSFNFEDLTQYSQVKDKIVYKLIHAEHNKELLKTIPHLPYLDMAIVFYILLDGDEVSQMTALVHGEHQKLWDITELQLYHIASDNTPLLLPSSLKNIDDVMREIAKVNLGDNYKDEFMDILIPSEEETPLYVLSNQKGLNGACAILYPDVLKNFGETVGSDVIILPSSIHEVLLIPYDTTLEFHELREMVSQINQSEVPLEDRLSDQIYYYSRESGQITMVPTSSGSDKTENPS